MNLGSMTLRKPLALVNNIAVIDEETLVSSLKSGKIDVLKAFIANNAHWKLWVTKDSKLPLAHLAISKLPFNEIFTLFRFKQ